MKPFNFGKLSVMEEDISYKASIPYRDQDLNSSKDDIIKKRLNEQLSSNLLSTKKWRKKWGMTKSAFRVRFVYKLKKNMLSVAILAAGKGTRMEGCQRFYKISGKSLLQRVIDSCVED